MEAAKFPDRYLAADPEHKVLLAKAEYTPRFDGALLARLARELEEEGESDRSDEVYSTLRRRQHDAKYGSRGFIGKCRGRLSSLLWGGLLNFGAAPLRPLLIVAPCYVLLAVALSARANITPSTIALAQSPAAFQSSAKPPVYGEHPGDWGVGRGILMASRYAIPLVDIKVLDEWQPSGEGSMQLLGFGTWFSPETWSAILALLDAIFLPIAIVALARKALIRWE